MSLASSEMFLRLQEMKKGAARIAHSAACTFDCSWLRPKSLTISWKETGCQAAGKRNQRKPPFGIPQTPVAELLQNCRVGH